MKDLFLDGKWHSLSSDDIRMLSEIGFMAALSGNLAPATRIFEALAILRPGLAFPYIGQAIAQLSIGALRTAVVILENALAFVTHDRDELQLYLAFSLQRLGSPQQASSIIHALLEAESLKGAQARLAAAMLREIEDGIRVLHPPRPAKIFEVEKLITGYSRGKPGRE